MRKFSLVLFAILFVATPAAFAQQANEELDDFNIPGVEKTLDELVGPEPDVSFPDRAKEPGAKDATANASEPQIAAPKPATPKVVEPAQPVEVPGVEWVRAVPDRSGLKKVSFEVPTSWKQKEGIWTLKNGDKIETGLKVKLDKFKEDDLAEAAKHMPDFSAEKRTINGTQVNIISSKRTIKKIDYVIKIAFFGAPMFDGKKQLMLMFSSADIERDMPIFEHVMQTVKSDIKKPETEQAASADPVVDVIPLKLVRVEPGKAGDLEGALEILRKDGAREGTKYSVAMVDLDGDGIEEAIIHINQPYGYCNDYEGSCRMVTMKKGGDQKWNYVLFKDFFYAKRVGLLSSSSNGYRDLAFDGVLFTFNGQSYQRGKSGEVEKKSAGKAEPKIADSAKKPNAIPVDVPGIKWLRVKSKEEELANITFEIPANWKFEKDRYMVREGKKIKIAFMLAFDKFRDKDIKQMKRDLKNYQEKTMVIGGQHARYFSGKMALPGQNTDTVMVVFDDLIFGNGYTFGFGLATSDIKRDGPIFEHILHSTRFEKPKPVARGIVPLKLEKVEIGKAGELEGALKEIESWSVGHKDTVYSVVRVDLNDDGVQEAIFHINQRYGYCKNFDANDGICRIVVMRLDEKGQWTSIPSPGAIYAKNIGILPSRTNGYRDLVFENVIYTYDGELSYRKGRQPEVAKKTPATNAVHSAAPSAGKLLENPSTMPNDKPAQPARVAILPGVDWVRVTSTNKEMKGISFDVPKNWVRTGEDDSWVLKAGSKIEVYLEILSLRLKGMELAATKAHLEKFASRKTVINGVAMEILTAENKHDGVMYNENFVFFGPNVSFADGKKTMMFNTSNIERDGPVFQHILQSVRFGQKMAKDPAPIDVGAQDKDLPERAYFMRGDQYVRYNIAQDKSDPGYPKSIDETIWPGVWQDGIDAAVNWGNGKVYFFKGKQYIQFDIAANHSDPGFPRNIDGSNWPGLWGTGVDAAVNWGDGKVYFFKGYQYIRFDIAANHSDPGFPRNIDGSNWPGLWGGGVGAATNWGNGKAYFFNRDQYIRFDIAANRPDSGYPRTMNSTNWPGLWGGDIGAAINWGGVVGRGAFKQNRPQAVSNASEAMPKEYRFEKANYWYSSYKIIRDFTSKQECARLCDVDPKCAVASFHDSTAEGGYANICALREKATSRHTEQIGIYSWVKGSAPAKVVANDNGAPVLANTSPDGPATYLGCFKDQGDPRGLSGRDLDGAILESSKMTINKCITECSGYAYAGVQYGRWCFCGNSYGKSGKASNCNRLCSGNETEICGGGWANSVYKLGSLAEATLPQQSANNWQTYANPRYGTSIEYPASLFEALPPPENGDGRKFETSDGGADFLIFGSYNALEQSVKELFGEQLMRIPFEAIMEKLVEKDRFTLRARGDGKIYVRKSIVDGSGVIHSFEMNYLQAQAAMFDPVAKRMLDSFSVTAKPPETPVSSGEPSKDDSGQAMELAFWQSISQSSDVADFKAYLALWPNGVFAQLAKNKIQRLNGAPVTDARPASDANIEPAPPPTVVTKEAPSGRIHNVRRKTNERKQIMNAARIPVSRKLGQKVIFVVSTVRSNGRWAYLEAEPRRPNGRKLNWATTPYARVWKSDMMSDIIMVLLRKDGGRWKVVEHIIGPTDVFWIGWVDQYGLPRALFSAP